jgi:hypothetical protein
MIPAKFAPILFGFILSGLMSLIVSGVSTALALGMSNFTVPAWIGAWLPSWGIAFPAVLIVAPIARRLVARMTRA